MRVIEAIRTLWGAGLMRVRPLPGVAVLSYHGAVERIRDQRLERNFLSVSAVREQLAALRRLSKVSLGDLEDMLDHSTLRPAIAATVDDGLTATAMLAELFDEAHIPFTLFVSTGPVARGSTIWTAELALLLLHGNAASVDCEGRQWGLRTREQRERAFQAIRVAMKALPADARRTAMDRLRASYPAGETERLLDEFPAFRALSWEQLRALRARGAIIGSHGVEHELHSPQQPASERQRELTQSRDDIETQLGAPCRYFSYPNGTMTAASHAELRAARYALGFGTQPGVIGAGADRLALARVEAGGSAASLVRHLRKAYRPEIAAS